MIGAIGAWMLRQACNEAASWRVPLQIAVNLSPVQFRYSDLAGPAPNLWPASTAALQGLKEQRGLAGKSCSYVSYGVDDAELVLAPVATPPGEGKLSERRAAAVRRLLVDRYHIGDSRLVERSVLAA